MSQTARTTMSFEQFLLWAMEQPGRYELLDGVPVAMAPERAGHVRTKFRVKLALDHAIDRAGLDCEAFIDGMTVRIDERTAYEPDVVVQCGPRLSDDALVVTDPVIAVEVLSPSTLSPSTQGRDAGVKLADYFKLPTLRHYLIVQSDPAVVIHHRRDGEGEIRTRILHGRSPSDGGLRLDPPGMALEVSDFFG